MQSAAASSLSAAALCDPWSAWRRARLLQLQSLSADELRSLLLREEERRLRLQSPIPPVAPMQDDAAAAASLAAFAAAFAPASAPAAASFGVAAAPTAAPASVFAAKTHTRADHDADLGAEASRTHARSMQSFAHGSPAVRLYRHALESIFALLQLHDLTQILAVSRSWSAAVRSMKPIGATIERNESQAKNEGKLFRPLPPIARLVASPLLRHLAGIRVLVEIDERCFATQLTSESLALLSQHAPNLTWLWCHLTLTAGAPLILPGKLTTLWLTLADTHTDAEINAVLVALAAHPSLSRLHLWVHAKRGVDLSLLAASRSLTELAIASCLGGHPKLSDANMKQIRSSLGHLTRIDVTGLGPADLARLLQPPVTARWQDIGTVTADARAGDLLATLPTLTRLHLDMLGARHADFLSKLPLLSALSMYGGQRIPAASLLASLLSCIGLTDLHVECDFSSSQVSTLLAALTTLKTLRLRCTMQSLQCFASGPATVTLEELHLSRLGPILPSSELMHLYALKGLRSLEVDIMFDSLDDAALANFSPPTALLPRLTRWVHESADSSHTRVVRTGPSFEWTQQRLTQ